MIDSGLQYHDWLLLFVSQIADNARLWSWKDFDYKELESSNHLLTILRYFLSRMTNGVGLIWERSPYMNTLSQIEIL